MISWQSLASHQDGGRCSDWRTLTMSQMKWVKLWLLIKV
jgi:hypothetical protein